MMADLDAKKSVPVARRIVLEGENLVLSSGPRGDTGDTQNHTHDSHTGFSPGDPNADTDGIVTILKVETNRETKSKFSSWPTCNLRMIPNSHNIYDLRRICKRSLSRLIIDTGKMMEGFVCIKRWKAKVLQV